MKEEYFLLKINKELCKYRNIPEDLKDHIIEVIKKDKEENLLPVILNDKERKMAFEGIDYQFKKAINITKLSPVELLKALDFHSKDTKFSKFEAMYAELRVIFFLSGKLKLYDIIPLKAKNEKSADFFAKGNSHKYAIEVFCKISKKLEDVIEISPEMPKEELKELSSKLKPIIKPDTSKFGLFRDYKSGAIEKKQQLDKTAEKYSCDKRILVMVLNKPNFLCTLVDYEYIEILKKIKNELGWGKSYHFAIVTGVLNLLESNIPEDVIYPPI